MRYGEDGRWVSEEGQKLIMAVPPPNELNGDDYIRWEGHLQNKYSVEEQDIGDDVYMEKIVEMKGSKKRANISVVS